MEKRNVDWTCNNFIFIHSWVVSFAISCWYSARQEQPQHHQRSPSPLLLCQGENHKHSLVTAMPLCLCKDIILKRWRANSGLRERSSPLPHSVSTLQFVWEEVWGCGEGQKQDSLQGEKCCHYDGTSLVRDGWAGLGVPFGWCPMSFGCCGWLWST